MPFTRKSFFSASNDSPSIKIIFPLNHTSPITRKINDIHNVVAKRKPNLIFQIESIIRQTFSFLRWCLTEKNEHWRAKRRSSNRREKESELGMNVIEGGKFLRSEEMSGFSRDSVIIFHVSFIKGWIFFNIDGWNYRNFVSTSNFDFRDEMKPWVIFDWKSLHKRCAMICVFHFLHFHFFKKKPKKFVVPKTFGLHTHTKKIFCEKPQNKSAAIGENLNTKFFIQSFFKILDEGNFGKKSLVHVDFFASQKNYCFSHQYENYFNHVLSNLQQFIESSAWVWLLKWGLNMKCI